MTIMNQTLRVNLKAADADMDKALGENMKVIEDINEKINVHDKLAEEVDQMESSLEYIQDCIRKTKEEQKYHIRNLRLQRDTQK